MYQKRERCVCTRQHAFCDENLKFFCCWKFKKLNIIILNSLYQQECWFNMFNTKIIFRNSILNSQRRTHLFCMQCMPTESVVQTVSKRRFSRSLTWEPRVLVWTLLKLRFKNTCKFTREKNIEWTASFKVSVRIRFQRLINIQLDWHSIIILNFQNC